MQQQQRAATSMELGQGILELCKFSFCLLALGVADDFLILFPLQVTTLTAVTVMFSYQSLFIHGSET